MVHDYHVACQALGLLHVVCGEEDGGSGLPVEVEHLAPEDLAVVGVKAGGGLVQEEDLGRVHHGAGDFEALGNAARIAAHVVVLAVRQAKL